jgi:RND family efflux transporter MFP subunit
MNSAKTSARLKNWLLPIVAVLGLLLIIAWMAGVFSDRIEPGLALLEPDQSREAIAVVREEIMVTEPVPASIGARQATTISSRTLARITQIAVRAGDTVSKGQLLLELERSDLESRLQQSNEQVRAVTARLNEARQSLDRAEQLYQRDLVAAAALDQARANHDALTADLATARQTVREAEVAISFTEIVSPIDGRVVERFAEPGDTASPGDKLLTLYNPVSMRIEAAVREGLALHLDLGQEIRIEVPVLEALLVARIEELVPAADPGSRSFMVKAQLDYNSSLMPGMYARMLIPAGSENLLLAPADRVVNYGQLEIVWVVNDGFVDRRFIRTGREVRPGMLEIVSGLNEGELVLPPR